MQTNIRKWGNSAGTILPSAVLAKAGIELGDKVDISAENGQITLRILSPKYTLDELLAATPNSKTKPSNEDKQWLESTTVGQELI